VAEVQALVGPAAGPPRRVTSGLDSSRVAMVLAVAERRAGVRLTGNDAYVSTVGGVRLAEPSADLAVALAVAGARLDTPLAPGTVAIGEVGLAGEIRTVPAVSRRLAEAARLGFTTAFIPANTSDPTPTPEGMMVLEVPDLLTALSKAAFPLAL
jgi:DNA repair protein RadA/Sms